MTPRLPRLAIVTPSLNTGRYIGAAINSVLEQRGAAPKAGNGESFNQPEIDFDYLVMDGGSTDGTVEVLKSFGPQLRWVSEKDKGQSDAISRGFARTEGEILGWLNSDDMFAPGAFRVVAEYFAAHPEVDLLYGDATYTDARGRHIADCVHVEPFNRRRLFRYSDFLVQPATFFRRRAFDAVGGIDSSINWAMDYDLWMRIVAGGFRVAYLPRVLAHFRWMTENKTATGGWDRLDEIVRLFRRQGNGPPAYVQLEQCNLHACDALASLRRGRIVPALKSLAKGAGIVLTSPRAVGSLLSPHTWHVIWVGQVLRARAAAAQRQESRAWPGGAGAAAAGPRGAVEPSTPLR